MKPKLVSILTLLGLMTVTSNISAQIDISNKYNIRAYIKCVDSLIKNEEKNNISTLIVDGVIEKKFIVTPKGGNKPRSFYLTIGGYGEEISSNKTRRDTIYKAEYSGGSNYYVHETYYYQNNKLVAAHVIVQDHKKILLDREEYYQDDKVIFSSTIRKRPNDIYLNKVSDSVFRKGTLYLKDFLAKNYPLH